MAKDPAKEPERKPVQRFFKIYPLQPTQLGVELPISGNCIKVRQANGTLTITTDKGDKDQMVFGEVTRFDNDFTSIKVTSTVPNDPVILSVGYGLKFEPSRAQVNIPPGSKIIVQYDHEGSGIAQDFQGDDFNAFVRSRDLMGLGSASPGGGSLFNATLDGQTWVTVCILNGFAVTGVSGIPQLATGLGGNVSVTPEVIDMKTGEIVNTLYPGTWFKIKVEGGSALHIPIGTLSGNGPANSFDVASQEGFTAWMDQEIAPITLFTNHSFNSGDPELDINVFKPKRALGFIVYLTGTFDAASAMTMTMLLVDPITKVSISATGSPIITFPPTNSLVVLALRFMTGTIEPFIQSAIPNEFILGFVESGRGVANEPLSATLEWIYE